jgi:hypothetical protein
MDTELHRVSDAVGDVEKVLLLAPATGVDITRHNVRHLLKH